MTRKYSSISVEQLLDSPMGAADTTLELDNSAAVTALLGGVTLAAGNVDQFTIAVDPDTASEEIIFVRNTSGAQLTSLLRGQAGTSATTHTSGATVKHVLTSNDLDFYTTGVATADAAVTLTGTQTLTNKTISADNNTISGIAATSFVLSNASGNIDGAAAQKVIPSGAVVGTTDTQTLTNKTIALGSNTISGTTAQFNTALTDGSFATLAGTETLTNKTIDYNSNTITNLPSSASQTLLSTTTLSGASTTISGISGSYNELYIYIYGVTQSSDSEISIGFNGSMTILSLFTYRTTSGTGGNEIENTSTFKITRSFNKNTSSNNSWLIKISNYTAGIAGNYANLKYEGGFSTASTTVALNGAGHIDTGSTAINEITITTSAGTFSGGTVKIYGIK